MYVPSTNADFVFRIDKPGFGQTVTIKYSEYLTAGGETSAGGGGVTTLADATDISTINPAGINKRIIDALAAKGVHVFKELRRWFR